MAPLPVFTLLCGAQVVLGFLMFVFGIVDRTVVEAQQSFMMLPIWIGILVGGAGFWGLVSGRMNKRQGYVDVNSASGVKAVNALCFGLCLVVVWTYSSLLSYIGYIEAVNAAAAMKYNPSGKTIPTIDPNLPSPSDNYTSADSKQGIMAMIVIFSMLQMFIGAWLIMMEKDQMVFGSISMSQDQRPLVFNEAPPPQQAVQQVPVLQSQPPQQQAYVPVVSQGSSQQPVLQQQQQPKYVMLQSPAVMATNQPYVVQQQQQQPQYVAVQQPQYVAVQNPPSSGNTMPSNTHMLPSNPQITPQQGTQNAPRQQNDLGATNQVEGSGEVHRDNLQPEANKLV